MRRPIMTLAAAVTFAVASGFTAQGQKANEVDFEIIATRTIGQSEADLGTVPRRHREGDGVQGERLLRLGLCRRNRGDAFQQGAGGLVR